MRLSEKAGKSVSIYKGHCPWDEAEHGVSGIHLVLSWRGLLMVPFPHSVGIH